MAAHVISSFNPTQTSTIQSIVNAWQNSSYSNNPSVLYQTIGIAAGEGMGIAPNAGHPDPTYNSYGPFQLNDGPNALGTTFANQYGLSSAGQGTLDQQSEFVVNQVGAGNTSPWMSVRDTGGIGNIQSVGQQTYNNAQSQGILSGTGSSSTTSGDPTDGQEFDSQSSFDTSPGQANTGFGDGTTFDYPAATSTDNGALFNNNVWSGTDESGASEDDTPFSSSGAASGMSVSAASPADTAALNAAPTTSSSSATSTVPATSTSSTSSTSGATNAGPGSQVDVSDIESEGSIGAKAQAQATTAAGTDVTKTGAALDSTLNSLTTSWFGEIEEVVINSGFIVLGLVVLAGAGLFFYIERKNVVELTA